MNDDIASTRKHLGFLPELNCMNQEISVLMAAITFERYSSIPLILAAGADPNRIETTALGSDLGLCNLVRKWQEKETPEILKVIESMLEYGADPDLKCEGVLSGLKSAYDLAKEKNSEALLTRFDNARLQSLRRQQA